jgi:hypothetical protein
MRENRKVEQLSSANQPALHSRFGEEGCLLLGLLMKAKGKAVSFIKG